MALHRFKANEFIVFGSLLYRHPLVWTLCPSHINGKEDGEAACLCEHAERTRLLNLTFVFQLLPNPQLFRKLKLFSFSLPGSSLKAKSSHTFSQVTDVAKAILNAIRDPDSNGKTYAIVG